MAAIKRSQANQRRDPGSYHLQQLHSNNPNGATILKVELKYFILSILDDPIVSRVFGEAGFRSCDIKLALVQPPVMQLPPRFSRSRCPPIFLCNLTDSDPVRGGFSFPFSGHEDSNPVDENSRRIAEVLARKSENNPLLIGVCAAEALRSFTESVQKGKAGFLPADLAGLSVISIEKEVSEFIISGSGEEKMGVKFKELGNFVEQFIGPGVVVNFGDLKGLAGDGVSGDAVSFVISKLAGLLETHNGRLWMMGAVESYELYSSLSARFPAMKDLDLHLLPITSSGSSFQGLYSKSSLMGSFVPLGGFFSTPSDIKSPVSSRNQSILRCQLCTEKCEQEVAAVLKGGSTISVADQCSKNLPSWLQMAALDTGNRVDAVKTKDDGPMLNAKVSGLQKKWNDICQRLHHTQPFPKLDIPQVRSQVPISECFRIVADAKKNSGEGSFVNENRLSNQSPQRHVDLQKPFLPRQNKLMPVVSEAENVNFQSREPEEASKTQQINTDGPWFAWMSRSLATGCTSVSLPAVTTDLKLGSHYASTSQEPRITRLQDHKERLQHLSGTVSVDFDAASEKTSPQFARSSPSSTLTSQGPFDLSDYKSIRKVLTEKVGWQDEAVSAISRTVSQFIAEQGRHDSSNPRRDIWITFLGPDRVGKRKIALALTEILFGSQENFISVDLSLQDKSTLSNSVFERQEMNGYDVKFRGKTVADYIVGELRKKPHSVVFLENVDKADFMVQSSLSQGIRTGRFPDSHGREISTNNVVFITTLSTTNSHKSVDHEKNAIKFSEERILGAKNWQMQLLSNCCLEDARSHDTRKVARVTETSSYSYVNKRKLVDACDLAEQEKIEMQGPSHKARRSCLDLNLPVEEMDESINSGECDSDSISENSEAWLEELFAQVQEKINFKPFDFDALAENISREISSHFMRTVGCEVALEIDQGAMVQILAAAWLSDKKGSIEDWLENVLGKSFAEAWQKYNLTSQSTVRLVACEGTIMEEQAPGVCLPAKIKLN